MFLMPGSRANRSVLRRLGISAPPISAAMQFQARAEIAAAKSPSYWTLTIFTSGSGTYTPPSGCKAIYVRMAGGGGGGAGSGTSPGAASAGGNSTFGSSFLTASGGSPGGSGGAGPGGTGTGGDLNLGGEMGYGYQVIYINPTAYVAGKGGGTVFGGAGSGGANVAGTAAAANTGSGGGGGCWTGTGISAGGGSAAGYLEKLIVSPLSSYAYAIGSGGAAGTAGGSGYAGGAGAAGIIIIHEYY